MDEVVPLALSEILESIRANIIFGDVNGGESAPVEFDQFLNSFLA